MPAIKLRYIIALFFLSWPFNSWCQVTDSSSRSAALPVEPVPVGAFTIGEIFISGNKKTKAETITRELPFKTGDTLYLPQVIAGFQRAKELLINTHLFNDVVISAKSFRGRTIDVQVTVRERWYIFPLPYFRPVDRNLSAWAEKNYSLSRANYGIRFMHSNFTGRNDRLRLWLITGYTRQLQLNYDHPAADRTLKHGFGFGVLYSALKEVNVFTNDNRQRFVNRDTLAGSGQYLFRQSSATLNYFYRPALTTRHLLRIGINYIQADSTLTAVNPKYFNHEVQKIVYPEFSYTLEYQKVDYIAYVLKGFMGDLNFTRKGINSDMNLSQFSGRFTSGWPLGGHFSAGLQGYGVLKLPLEQPYFNQRLFGYGDIYLRGLEKYVVDGVAGTLLRSTLRRELWHFSLNGGRIPTLATIPFSIYAKIFGDLGYAYSKTFTQNSLVNRPLYTAGMGIDVVSVYDFVFRCEYSLNQLGQSGFFFHIRNDF